jgi:proteasome lid subunit RPN8/RPN11
MTIAPPPRPARALYAPPYQPKMPPAFGNPVFPAAWSAAVGEAALKHTQDCYPQEAVGIVEGGQYVRLANLAFDPEESVRLGDADLVRVAASELFFHSHPDGLCCPSEADMTYQQQLGIPFVILQWPLGDCFCFGEQLEPAPLIGRAFRHGVHDCYSLCRDWYRQRGLTLLDQPRGWQWWTKGRAFYVDRFRDAGFVDIPVGEATRPGDGLLFRFTYPTPMHAALVDDDPQLLLNHMAGRYEVDFTRLSGRIPRARWVRHAVMALRYGG